MLATEITATPFITFNGTPDALKDTLAGCIASTIVLDFTPLVRALLDLTRLFLHPSKKHGGAFDGGLKETD